MCFMLAIRSLFFRAVNNYSFFFLFKNFYSRREGESKVGKTERDGDRDRERGTADIKVTTDPTQE